MTTTPAGTTPIGSILAGTTLTGATTGPVARTPAPDVSELIAAAVLAVPGVAGLHGGSFGQVASYLPGRSVVGIRVRPDVTDVHVVLFWGTPVLAAADQVRAVVQPLITGLSARVDVTVDDIVDPPPAPDPDPVTDPSMVPGPSMVAAPDQALVQTTVVQVGSAQPPTPVAPDTKPIIAP